MGVHSRQAWHLWFKRIALAFVDNNSHLYSASRDKEARRKGMVAINRSHGPDHPYRISRTALRRFCQS